MSNDSDEVLNRLPREIRNVIAHELSPDSLRNKISELSPRDKKKLDEIKKELKIEDNEEIIKFLISGISAGVVDVKKNSDRSLLSVPLMQELDKLKRIKYTEKIKLFKNKCETSSDELYSLVLETLHTLWVDKYQKEEAYQRFEIYKDFEKLLFKDPRYRDHFIHQFQVFLSGLPIIECNYDDIVKSYSKLFDTEINIDLSWLLAATFHDIGYLIQQFDKWLNCFFKDFLNISELPINLDIWKLFLIRDFQDYLDKFTSLYISLYRIQNQKGWTFNSSHLMDHELRKLFTSKMVNERNHGIISALILLDRIDNSKIAQENLNYKNTTFSSVVMPSGLSIALHDKAVFLDKKIDIIDFKKDPLTFILIYCDLIQEWGRPTSPVLAESSDFVPHLTNFEPEYRQFLVSRDKK